MTGSVNEAVTCAKCFTPLPRSMLNATAPQPCPGCATLVQAFVFPALFRVNTGINTGELAVEEGQAVCFYHPQKSAHVPCDACGRFICALCDIELHGEHLCPACIENGRRKGKITTLENRRVLHDNIALSLAVLPLIMWPFTIITAPAAVILAVATWKKPTSITPRTKIRFILAIIFAALTLAGWAVGIFMLTQAIRTAGD